MSEVSYNCRAKFRVVRALCFLICGSNHTKSLMSDGLEIESCSMCNASTADLNPETYKRVVEIEKIQQDEK